jgi:hypothetical protein
VQQQIRYRKASLLDHPVVGCGQSSVWNAEVLPATNVTAQAMSGVCIGADFAILRNRMADNRLDSPARQMTVMLNNYRSCPALTARKRLPISTPKLSLF